MAERAPVEQAMASPRIAIEAVAPTVEQGRYPAKVLEGRAVALSAVLICDGHGLLNAEILWCTQAEGVWQDLPMTHLGNDLWQAELTPQRSGMLHFVVQAWMDSWATYCDELHKKHQAGVPVELELLEGQRLIQDALDNADGEQAALTLFSIEKAAYEINYEASYRPEWLDVPLAGLAELGKPLVENGNGR